MTPVNSSINTVEVIFWFLALSYIVVGLAINVLHRFLPTFVRRLLFYGKISGNGTHKDLLSLLIIPKSWFRHFYLFATIWSSLVMLLTIGGFASGHISSHFIDFLNGICGSHRTVQNNSLETSLALLLLYIHILVRCYETHFTQVFSKKATMNLIQYFTSFVYYFGVITLLVCRGQGFISGSAPAQLRLEDFSWRLIVCCLFFVYASYHQFRSHSILVNLRRDRSGRVTSEGHFLPTGGFFEIVSSPHMMFECLIYLSIFGIVYRNSSWLAVLALVAANQITMAYETHLWYRKNFPNYPIHRRALIPFIF